MPLGVGDRGVELLAGEEQVHEADERAQRQARDQPPEARGEDEQRGQQLDGQPDEVEHHRRRRQAQGLRQQRGEPRGQHQVAGARGEQGVGAPVVGVGEVHLAVLGPELRMEDGVGPAGDEDADGEEDVPRDRDPPHRGAVECRRPPRGAMHPEHSDRPLADRLLVPTGR